MTDDKNPYLHVAFPKEALAVLAPCSLLLAACGLQLAPCSLLLAHCAKSQLVILPSAEPEAAPSQDPVALDTKLRSLPGVVETGIFVGMATEVFIAKVDGTVEHRTE